LNQEKTSKTIAHGPQRIYGIVRSGKIIRLTQKAAYMHLKHPNWDITLMSHPLAVRPEHLAGELLVTGLQQGRQHHLGRRIRPAVVKLPFAAEALLTGAWQVRSTCNSSTQC